MDMQEFLAQNLWMILAFVAWTLAWKGVSLWKAARNGHKEWFVILLVVNTLGLLEIAYIYFFADKSTASKQDVNKL